MNKPGSHLEALGGHLVDLYRLASFNVSLVATDTAPAVDDAANPENNTTTVDLEITDKNDYSRFFKDHWRADVSSMIWSGRNHPSVVMWSLGNEIPNLADETGPPLYYVLLHAWLRLFGEGEAAVRLRRQGAKVQPRLTA